MNFRKTKKFLDSTFVFFIKLINCQNVTFQEVVETFYAKAGKLQIKMKPKLDFLYNLNKDLAKIRIKYAKPMDKIFSSGSITNLLNQMPKEMKINNMRAHNFWTKRVKGLDGGALLIANSYRRICAEIDLKSPNVYNTDFNKLYKEWNSQTIDKKYVERIDKQVEHMKDARASFILKLNEAIAESNEAEEMLLEYTRVAGVIFKDISKAKGAAKEQLIHDANEATNKIANQQSKVFQLIKKVQNTLTNYNVERTSHASEIIGSKED